MLNYWLIAICAKMLFQVIFSNLCHSIVVVCDQPGFSNPDTGCFTSGSSVVDTGSFTPGFCDRVV